MIFLLTFESGADVTEIINGVVSSGLVQVDELVESLNKRFYGIAQFYLSKQGTRWLQINNDLYKWSDALE